MNQPFRGSGTAVKTKTKLLFSHLKSSHLDGIKHFILCNHRLINVEILETILRILLTVGDIHITMKIISISGELKIF